MKKIVPILIILCIMLTGCGGETTNVTTESSQITEETSQVTEENSPVESETTKESQTITYKDITFETNAEIIEKENGLDILYEKNVSTAGLFTSESMETDELADAMASTTAYTIMQDLGCENIEKSTYDIDGTNAHMTSGNFEYSGRSLKGIVVAFNHNGTYYQFSFSTDPDKYDYSQDFMDMMDSIKLQ